MNLRKGESMEEKRYPAECNVCGCQFEATKSIFHDMGIMDLGRGICPGCKTALNLTFDSKNQRMVSKTWKAYLQESNTHV